MSSGLHSKRARNSVLVFGVNSEKSDGVPNFEPNPFSSMAKTDSVTALAPMEVMSFSISHDLISFKPVFLDGRSS